MPDKLPPSTIDRGDLDHHLLYANPGGNGIPTIPTRELNRPSCTKDLPNTDPPFPPKPDYSVPDCGK